MAGQKIFAAYKKGKMLSDAKVILDFYKWINICTCNKSLIKNREHSQISF
jgi:hypothetical protein